MLALSSGIQRPPSYTTIAFIGGIAASVKAKENPEQIANVKQLPGKERPERTKINGPPSPHGSGDGTGGRGG
jgi:hypothetical protein